MNFLWPVQGNITSGYGNRTILGVTSFHNGIDIGAPNKSSVVAAADGKITYSGFDPTGGGNIIIIQHAGGYQTLYMHLSHFSQSGGAQVKAGQQIALSGGMLGEVGAGNSTGAHLHFGVELNGKYIDPMSVLVAGGGASISAAPAGQTPGVVGTPTPARHWWDINPNDWISGKIANSAPGQAVSSALSLGAVVGTLGNFLTQSSNWKRIGLGAIGAVILVIVAIELTSESSVVQTVAKAV